MPAFILLPSGPGTHVSGSASGGGRTARHRSALVSLVNSAILSRTHSRFTFPRRREQLQGGGYGLDIDNARTFGAIRMRRFSTTVDPRLIND